MEVQDGRVGGKSGRRTAMLLLRGQGQLRQGDMVGPGEYGQDASRGMRQRPGHATEEAGEGPWGQVSEFL